MQQGSLSAAHVGTVEDLLPPATVTSPVQASGTAV